MGQMREMLTAMTGLVSPSHFLADRFAGWIGAPVDIAMVENGLRRAPEARPGRHLGDDEPWVFGYFGQINPYKGVDVLLRAAENYAAASNGGGKRIIRIHGPLVGQSAEFVERLDRAVAAGVVEYSGPYQNENVGDLMAACDYVVVPSLWWENSPVVIQEAFAAGRPLLVSGIGGMAEKVQDGVHGFHFAPGNVTDLLRALAQASDGEAYRRLLGQMPRTQTAEDMARAYLDVFARTTSLSEDPIAA
jgi:glycosyltransferase involved in cell wall biosynthesis